MTSVKELKQSLPIHFRSSSVSSSGTISPSSITSLTIPKKLITKSYFFPTIIIFILFLLYSTQNLYNSPVGSRSLSSGKGILKSSKAGDVSSLWKNVGVEIDLSHTLEARLKDWENSPLDGLEPSDWVSNSIKVSYHNSSTFRNLTRKAKRSLLLLFLRHVQLVESLLIKIKYNWNNLTYCGVL